MRSWRIMYKKSEERREIGTKKQITPTHKKREIHPQEKQGEKSKLDSPQKNKRQLAKH